MVAAHQSSAPHVCLVIGDPIAHSLSPAMHNAAYAALGLNFKMNRERVASQDLKAMLERVRSRGIRGLAVTMPHKTTIPSLIDRIDPVAETIGAVNTVVNDSGVLTGYNTDWLGILRPLEAVVDLKGRSVALLGAGGAAQAAAYACAQSGASVTIFYRSRERAEHLARKFSCGVCLMDDTAQLLAHDVIINTTPVGMAPDTILSPIPASALAPHHTVFETIYSPPVTALLKQSRDAGAKTISGFEMFLEQGAAQFQLHTGHEPPLEEMKRALRASNNGSHTEP
jgi:shikimate dehydrogenase